jgi:bacterioferritin-associated ferredoxin
MTICVCKNISTRQIAIAVSDGVNTLHDLIQKLGIGTGCGTCVNEAARVLRALNNPYDRLI